MARRAFYSFHYVPDNWRASQVRNMGVLEGNAPVSDNDWEAVTGGGDKAIEAWINEQLSGRSCTVVLIGKNTAGRKWINYEIIKSWNDNKGVVGVYIHYLKNHGGNNTFKGGNPFDEITLGTTGEKLSSVVKAYDPPFTSSTYVYNHISDNLEGWVEAAIQIRNDN